MLSSPWYGRKLGVLAQPETPLAGAHISLIGVGCGILRTSSGQAVLRRWIGPRVPELFQHIVQGPSS